MSVSVPIKILLGYSCLQHVFLTQCVSRSKLGEIYPSLSSDRGPRVIHSVAREEEELEKLVFEELKRNVLKHISHRKISPGFTGIPVFLAHK